eukprot:1104194-Rhodomonas_salina.1
MSGSGQGRELRTSLTTGMQVGTLSEAVSYAAPAVSGRRADNAAGSSASTVTVLGSGLGVSAESSAARAGSTGAELSDWVSDTSMVCKTLRVVSEARAGMDVVVTAGVAGGSMSKAF